MTAGSAVLASGSLSLGTQTVTAQGQTGTSDPSVQRGIFEVHYPDGYENTAEQTLNWANSIHKTLDQAYPSDIDLSNETIHILLNTGDVNGRMNWNADPYRIHARVIENGQMGPVEYREVLAHEYMNIVLNSHSVSNTGNWPRSPLWFREGLSDYYVYQHTSEQITDERFPTRFIKNRYEEIRNGLGYFEIMTQNNYSGGYLICEYTIDEFGTQPLFNLIKRDGDWESDIEDELGVGYDEWRRGWLEWAEDNIGGKYNIKVASIAELDSLAAEQQERIAELSEQGISLTSKPTELLVGQPIEFETEAGSQDISSTSWDFDDGTVADGTAVTHTFKRSGTYEVEVVVDLADGSTETRTQEVVITEMDGTEQVNDSDETEESDGADDPDGGNDSGEVENSNPDSAESESDSKSDSDTESEQSVSSNPEDETADEVAGFGIGTALLSLVSGRYLLKNKQSSEDEGLL